MIVYLSTCLVECRCTILPLHHFLWFVFIAAFTCRYSTSLFCLDTSMISIRNDRLIDFMLTKSVSEKCSDNPEAEIFIESYETISNMILYYTSMSYVLDYRRHGKLCHFAKSERNTWLPSWSTKVLMVRRLSINHVERDISLLAWSKAFASFYLCTSVIICLCCGFYLHSTSRSCLDTQYKYDKHLKWLIDWFYANNECGRYHRSCGSWKVEMF